MVRLAWPPWFAELIQQAAPFNTNNCFPPVVNSHPIFSVIVPVFNDTERLKRCIESLAKQSIGVEHIEVFVIDNGSNTSPRTLVESHDFCCYLEESKPGSYAARNRALNSALGKILAFTDSDCLPEPDWLAEALKEVEKDFRHVVVGGAIEVFPQNAASPSAVELVDIAFGLDQKSNILKTGFAVTANLIVSRAAFDDVGPFDDSLKSGGDHEWCLRAVDAGKELCYVESALVRHPARQSLSELNNQIRRHVGGRVDRRKKQPYRPLTLHFWWTVGRLIFPNIKQMLRARRRLSARGYGGVHWIRSIPVIFLMQYVRVSEFVAKILGGASERR
jgi:GT2 family glycosyltransferase